MTMPGLQLLAQLGAERILNSIPEGLLIAAFAWLLLRAVGRQNSGTRFAIWFFTLLAIAVVPFAPTLTKGGAVSHTARSGIILPGSWAVAILAGWTLVAALGAVRVGFGLLKLPGLRRNCLAIATSDLPTVLRQTVELFKNNRQVTICRSSDVRVPTAIGFFKPIILIPDWTLRELSAEELRVVLLHEFAHLRRRDDWTNLAQKMVRILFFFHPAVWWIERRLSLEREMACDDVVLAETGNPRAYAECLVALTEKSFVRRGLAMAQAAISHAYDTSLRLAQILDVNRPNVARVFKPAMVVGAAFSALCLIVLPNAPRLIAFENPAPPVVASAQAVRQVPQAVVVPVIARTDSDAIPVPRKLSMPTRAVKRQAKLPDLVAAKQKQQKFGARPTLLVRTAAKKTTPPPQFLVVTQTTECDGYGAAILRLSVWRVTVAPEGRSAGQVEVTAKSI
jgi:beta-lactamase regulating signal transducer with metallopeptidase domain